MALYRSLLTPYLHGRILDIGAGQDPVTKNAVVFDKTEGDAQHADQYFSKDSFDSVFSSHCLEHMVDPSSAIKSWFSLVKPGGYLIILVPDEDLYEQGHFPSIFNTDHKATFTISKSKSWSTKSYNCLELCDSLGGELVYLSQQSDNYDFRKLSHKKTGILKLPIIRQVLRIQIVRRLAPHLGMMPLDQTSRNSSTLAQICFIVRK